MFLGLGWVMWCCALEAVNLMFCACQALIQSIQMPMFHGAKTLQMGSHQLWVCPESRRKRFLAATTRIVQLLRQLTQGLLRYAKDARFGLLPNRFTPLACQREAIYVSRLLHHLRQDQYGARHALNASGQFVKLLCVHAALRVGGCDA
jgi:hypothetical protein